MDNNSIVKGALAGLVALGALGLAGGVIAAPSWARTGDTLEKCGGVAKAARNDCGANGHQCGGMAAADSDPAEWVYVPAGVCEKLAGGTVIATKTIK
jgi:uncharacterized membrane protein